MHPSFIKSVGKYAAPFMAWVLAMAGNALLPGAAYSQNEAATSTQSQRNEQNLNAVFQRAIQTLPSAQQTALRKAERAWIEFRDKSAAAFEIAGRKRGMGDLQMQQMKNFELIARTREILQFMNPSATARDQMQAAFKRADESLNTAYKQMIETLDEAGKNSMREAQRAWIAFRDENARAFANGTPADTINAAVVLTTMHRADQLRGFVAGKPASPPYYGADPVGPAAVPMPVETPDPSFPDPFASVR